eukprot:Partr_v1_DN25311_c0_g1_i2_m21673 putative Chromosome 9 open reading frame 64
MNILNSAKFIADNSQHVSIPRDGVKAAAVFIAEQMKRSQYSFKTWKSHPLNPKTCNEQTIDWIFLVDLLNFSFFSSQQPEYSVTLNGTRYTGYWTLCASINRALTAGIPIVSPSYFADISNHDASLVFRSDNEAVIPMLEERCLIMRQAGSVLRDVLNFDKQTHKFELIVISGMADH